MTRYRLDASWRRPGDGRVVLAGSPLRLFRLSQGGAHVMSLVEHGTQTDTPSVREFLDRFVAAGALHPLPDTAPFTIDDVTVVMPFHERDAAVAAGVRLPFGVRGVLVDDASPGAAPEPGGTVVLRSTNGGPGAARNTGLRSVETALVAFVDSDVVLPDDPRAWLAPLLVHFSDPKVALVAPRVASMPGDTTVAHYETHRSPLDLGDQPARVEPGTRVSYVPAAVIVCRTDAVRDLGGFDEGLRFGEDVDLVWRLVAAGHRARYEPTVVVHHRARPHWRAVWRQRMGYGSSAAPLSARHHGALAPARMSGWSLLVWLLVAARRPLLAAGVVAGTVVALQRRLQQLPRAESARLVLSGHLAAGRQLAVATRRVWWPLALVAALVSRRARPVVVAALLAPAVAEAVAARRAPSAPALTDAAAALADDIAYGAGVWRGVWETGETGALLPAITTWPRRGDG